MAYCFLMRTTDRILISSLPHVPDQAKQKLILLFCLKVTLYLSVIPHQHFLCNQKVISPIIMDRYVVTFSILSRYIRLTPRQPPLPTNQKQQNVIEFSKTLLSPTTLFFMYKMFYKFFHSFFDPRVFIIFYST